MSPIRMSVVIPVACIALMGVLGAVQLGLNAFVQFSIDDFDDHDTYLGVSTRTYSGRFYSTRNIALRALPASLNNIGTGLVFWSSIGAIVDTILLLWLLSGQQYFTLEWPKDGVNVKHSHVRVKTIVYVILTVVILRPLVVFLYIFIYYYAKATHSLALLDPYNVTLSEYPSRGGSFTPESWFCGITPRISRRSGPGSRSQLNRLCEEAMTTRWILIPMLIVSFLVAVSVFCMQKVASARTEHQKHEVVDVQRDGSPSNADTLKEDSEDVERGPEENKALATRH